VARTIPNIELANRVAALAGPGFERVYFVSGGSEGIETAIKFLRVYAWTKGEDARRNVISVMPSYHGGTIATLGIGGDDEAGRPFVGMTAFSSKVPAPFTYRIPDAYDAGSYARHCADALEQQILRLGPETVLAFVLEPVGGVSTGALVPHDDYMRAVREICTRYGVYLVFDEVMSGAGRTGKFLAAHHWPDAPPDIVVLAKGIGAGFTPLGAMLAPGAMVDELAEIGGFNISHTYMANPLTCAIGLAVLDEVEERDLIGNAARLGGYLRRRLEELKEESAIVGDVRGLGLLMALEVVRDKGVKATLPEHVVAANRLRVIGMEHGLMLYARRTNRGRFGDWVMVSPPLTITRDEVDEIVGRLGDTLRDFEKELRREGLLPGRG
jgi:adenosylmethionine-8-amino-7-oxononanoate aminotransferase